MALKKTTDPAALAVLLSDAKAHMRIDDTTEDDYITTLINAAIEWVEDYCQRQAVNATYQLKLDTFPSDAIEIAVSPVSSITSITYVDTDGDTQTWSSDDYDVDTHSIPARIKPAYGESFPSTRDQMNAVTVTFVAGYGTGNTNVPEGLRQAIKILVANLYENRESIVTGTIVSKIPTLDMLLRQYKVFRYR